MALAAIVTLGAFRFPGPLLWLLGDKYKDLRPDIGWAVAASCFSYATSVFWIMNTARKFLFWWYMAANVASMLLSQVICVAVMDLSTTRHVIYFILIGNAATFLVHVAGGIYGLAKTHTHAAEHATA